MLVVRGTKKLRDRLRATPVADNDVSTTVLGDWFGTALFWKPQVALLVNERTLLPVFMPLAPAATLLDRAPDAIASVLRRHQVDDAIIESELAAMRDIRIAPTNNRSVLGVMNEFAFQGENLIGSVMDDLEDLSMWLSELLVGPLMKGTGTPKEELIAVLGAGSSERPASNVIPFPGSYRPDAEAASIYQLKVTLLRVTPPVWRRVLVDGSSTLDHVHEVIQAAFGWWDHHLHEFEVDGRSYGVPDLDEDWGRPTLDERNVRLDTIAAAGSSISYTYDFGDGWDHKITVEKVLPATTDTSVPACIGGRRACPPEDCGGPWGYADLLEILSDPTHPEHRERVEWIGRPFDPEAFDPGDFADNLREGGYARFDD